MKLHTGRGNGGETDLLVGGRIKKSALRVEAYGTVDELNSGIGLSGFHMQDKLVNQLLLQVQEKLFVLGSDLAATKGERIPRITKEHVKWIESVIDEVSQWAYVFCNRLSSLLFGLSLLVNQRLGVEETKWIYKT
jgi:cob(I)alamin adenosyltransferase